VDFRKLKYFQAVVEAGSLHRASEKLRVAQPALSKSIKSLEEALGVRLLIRHSKGVEVTEEGASLHRHAAEILAAWKIAEADVKEHSLDLTGTVSLGAPPTLAQYVFGNICSEVAKAYPRLRLEFYEGVGHSLWEELHLDRLDIAVIGETEGSDRIIKELVTHENIFLLGPPGVKVSHPIERIETLADFPLIVTTRAPTGRSWFENISRHSGYSYDIKYRVESPQVAKDLVARGLGYAVLPHSGVFQELHDGSLPVSHIRPLKLPRAMASRKERYLHPSVAFVRNLLRAQLLRLDKEETSRSDWDRP